MTLVLIMEGLSFLQLSDEDEQTRLARDRVGRLLRDRWRLDELLGIGGMAAVYAATHRNGKRVAVKVLNGDVPLIDKGVSHNGLARASPGKAALKGIDRGEVGRMR